MDVSRLGLRDPRSPGGVMGDPCGTQKIKSTWAEARYVSASGWHGDRVEMVGLGGLGLKTTTQSGLPVWASKLRGVSRVDGWR